jgi:hypothetical protein
LYCKRFATTTEAEIEEKRLKWNAERTIKQNKAAAAILKDYLFQKKMETGKNIAYNYTVTCIMCAVWYIMQDIWIRL